MHGRGARQPAAAGAGPISPSSSGYNSCSSSPISDHEWFRSGPFCPKASPTPSPTRWFPPRWDAHGRKPTPRALSSRVPVAHVEGLDRAHYEAFWGPFRCQRARSHLLSTPPCREPQRPRPAPLLRSAPSTSPGACYATHHPSANHTYEDSYPLIHRALHASARDYLGECVHSYPLAPRSCCWRSSILKAAEVFAGCCWLLPLLLRRRLTGACSGSRDHARGG